MSLLEGHGTFVMNQVARGRIEGAERFDRTLHERRNRAGMEKMLHKVIGFDMKVRQYEMGERFVASVVGRVGMDGFNRVWAHPDHLPTLEEISHPDLWVARVGAA